MNGTVAIRLCTMMFLQYAVQGIWLPIAPRFLSAPQDQGGLGFTDAQIGMIIAVAGAIGAIASPLVAGQVADRYFATQKILGFLLVTAGVLKIIIASQTSYSVWLSLSVAGAIVYAPTVALTNSLALYHLMDPKRQFPSVRVWGTISWIAVAWLFPMLWLQTNLRLRWLPPFFTGENVPDAPARMIDAVTAAGVIAVAYGFFCWIGLPHTPPKKDAVEKVAFVTAFRLLRRRSLTVLLVAALPISALHSIYFLQTSKFLVAIGLTDSYVMPAMSVGQLSEIVVMALLGRMLGRAGFRAVITLGAFSYFARFAIFGTTGLPLAVIIGSQFLHGFCFACFVVGSLIYLDRMAPPDVRHSLQTVFMLVVSGAGSLLAGRLNGLLSQMLTSGDGLLNYQQFWYLLAAVGLAATVCFGLFFRDETEVIVPSA